MGFSSQGGRIVLRTQAAPHTYPTDMATAGIVLKITGGALDPQRTLMVPDAEIGGGRDVNDAYLGPVVWTGTYNFYCRMDALPTLLNAALGSTSTVTTTGVNVNTTVPSDGPGLPFLAIEESIGAGLEVFQYTDVVVNTLHLECAADGYMTGTAGLIAAKQLAGTAPVASTVPQDSSPMTVGTNIGLTYNGVLLPAKSFSFDLNNNFENNDYRLGSFFVGALTPKRREATMGFAYRPDDSTIWRQAVYGSPSAVSPGGLVTKAPAVLTCNTYEPIAGSTPPTTRSLAISAPTVAFEPFAFAPSGDNVIQSDVTLQLLRPDTAQKLLTAVVTNGLAAVA